MSALPLEVVVRGGESIAVHKLDPGLALLGMRPTPVDAELTEIEGQFVLTTPDRRVYLRLSPDQARMWEMIDGKSTVAEIVTAWFLTVGSLDVARVLSFMHVLRKAGLVETEPVGFLRSKLGDQMRLPEWRWTGMQEFSQRIWNMIGGMFTGWTVPIWFTTVALGGWALNTESRIFEFSLGAVVPVILASGVVHILIHELAHAMAVISAGRKVRHLGIGLTGLYVDTTDLYLGTRAEHAVASLAGPATNIVLSGLLATMARASGGFMAESLWVASGTGFALALLTGWPFLLENDGYRAFCDMSGEPHLRKAGWIAVLAGKANAAQIAYSVGSVLTVAGVIVIGILAAS